MLILSNRSFPFSNQLFPDQCELIHITHPGILNRPAGFLCEDSGIARDAVPYFCQGYFVRKLQLSVAVIVIRN